MYRCTYPATLSSCLPSACRICIHWQFIYLSFVHEPSPFFLSFTSLPSLPSSQYPFLHPRIKIIQTMTLMKPCHSNDDNNNVVNSSDVCCLMPIAYCLCCMLLPLMTWMWISTSTWIWTWRCIWTCKPPPKPNPLSPNSQNSFLKVINSVKMIKNPFLFLSFSFFFF